MSQMAAAMFQSSTKSRIHSGQSHHVSAILDSFILISADGQLTCSCCAASGSRCLSVLTCILLMWRFST